MLWTLQKDNGNMHSMQSSNTAMTKKGKNEEKNIEIVIHRISIIKNKGKNYRCVGFLGEKRLKIIAKNKHFLTSLFDKESLDIEKEG